MAKSLKLACSFRFADAGVECVDCELGLLLVDNQRRRKSQRIFSCPKDEQSFVERSLKHAVPQLGRSFFGFLVAHELDSDHQSFAANVAHALVPLAPIGRSCEE